MYRFHHPSAPDTRPEQKPEQSRSISLKKALAIGAVPLVLLFSAAFQSPNSVPGQLQAILSEISGLKSQNSGLTSEISGLTSEISALESQISGLEAKVDSLASKGPRKFYLTRPETRNGAQALSACADGYHMASLYEIHDTSNLRYDTLLGHTLGDSGLGPPTANFGWIRTGAVSFGGSVDPGIGNCDAWTSADANRAGTGVALNALWNLSPNLISPWQGSSRFCNTTHRVWCVQD